MKKILILLMTAFVIFGMTACGEEKEPDKVYEEKNDSDDGEDRDEKVEEKKDNEDKETKEDYEFNEETNFAGIILHYYDAGNGHRSDRGYIVGDDDYCVILEDVDEIFDGESLEELPKWCESYLIDTLTNWIYLFREKEIEITEQFSEKITNSNGCEMMRVESLVEDLESGETVEIVSLYILGGVDNDVAIYITAIPETDGYSTGALIDAIAEQIEDNRE